MPIEQNIATKIDVEKATVFGLRLRRENRIKEDVEKVKLDDSNRVLLEKDNLRDKKRKKWT